MARRDPRFDEAADALQRVQDAAAIFRRSQVLVELDDEERRIFDAVVKPDRVKANGNAQTEIERLRKESSAPSGCSGTSGSCRTRPEVVAAEREKLERYARAARARSRLDAVQDSRPGKPHREVEATPAGAAGRGPPRRRHGLGGMPIGVGGGGLG